MTNSAAPPAAPGQPIPFHQFDDRTFEKLCREIIDREPNTVTCELYGVPGQKQHGIDLLAPLHQRSHYDVAQCKNYREFPPRLIRKASDDFFKHWEAQWSSWNLDRFILIVASDVSNRQRQDEIGIQRRRFAEVDLDYEVWSPTQLRRKLAPYPGLVREYFRNAEYWVDEICGRETPPLRQGSDTGAAVEYLLEDISSSLSRSIRGDIERLREEWRRGRFRSVREDVQAIRNDRPRWSLLEPNAKAEILRLEASLCLASRDLAGAEALVRQARKFAPNGDYRRIEALIALHGRDDPQGAISEIGEPSSVEDQHLLAGALLATGATEQATDQLRQVETPTAETHRLRALIALAKGEFNAAVLEGKQARELATEWESTRFLVAALGYLGTLSPSRRPPQLPDWPKPVDWVFVRRSDHALRELRSSRQELRKLYERRQSEAADVAALQTWLLATLANDPEEQEAARELAATLLSATPTHTGAIAWVVARNYEVDLAPSRAALEAAVEEQDRDLQTYLALFAILLAEDEVAAAESLLESSLDEFETAGEVHLWTAWKTQVLLRKGETEEALTSLDREESPDIWGEVVARDSRIRGTEDAAIDTLDAAYSDTGSPTLLLHACMLAAEIGKWGFVADRASRLETTFDTAEAAGMAAEALARAGRWREAQETLDRSEGRFPDEKLPPYLRRIRVEAQSRLGAVPDAIREAQEVVAEDPSTPNLLLLARLRSQIGDMPAVATVARELVKRDDVRFSDLLSLAQLIATDEQPLAQRLWRAAVHVGIPDSDLEGALVLGYRLELDEEVAPLFRRLMEMGEDPAKGRVVVSEVDLPAFLQQGRQRWENLNEAYAQGLLPVHYIAPALNVSLVELYHGNLVDNERRPDPANQLALRIRHGSRGQIAALPEPAAGVGRIILDITAVLLARHLGLLTTVEAAFAPLYLPQDLIPALVRYRHALDHHQPSRVVFQRQILDAIEREEVAPHALREAPPDEWVEEYGPARASWLRAAEECDAFLLLDIDESISREASSGGASVGPVDARVIDHRAILSFLRDLGPLSEAAYAQAVEALPQDDSQDGNTQLTEGAPVLAPMHSIEKLLRLGILPLACDRLQLFVPSDEVEIGRRTIQYSERNRPLLQWTRDLIIHLQEGLAEGTYRLLPLTEGREEYSDEDADSLSGLRELLEYDAAPGDIIWVDDRFTTGYWRQNSAVIAGTAEVLQLLADRGEIDGRQLLHWSLRLRASNAWYVSYSEEELPHHVRQARVTDAGLAETEALTILRRSQGAVLLNGSSLRNPTNDEGVVDPKNEMPFVLGLGHSVREALLHLRQDEDDQATADAQSDWLLHNMYVDPGHLRRLVGLSNESDDLRALKAVGVAGLISNLLQLPEGRADQYRAWLNARVLSPSAAADSAFPAAVANVLRPTLFADSWGLDEDIAAVLQHNIFMQLPAVLQEQYQQDPTLMSRIGIQYLTAVTVGPWSFSQDTFFRGAHAAVNGRSEHVSPIESDEKVLFRPTTERGGITLSGDQSGQKVQLNAPILPILSDSVGDRERWLSAHKDLFDGSPAERVDSYAVIAAEENAQVRYEQVQSLWATYLRRHYDELVPKLAEGKAGYHELMPDDLKRGLSFFYLGTGGASNDTIKRGIKFLAEEESVVEAFRRFGATPTPVFDDLFGEITARDDSAREDVVRKLCELAVHPVADIHLQALLWQLGSDDQRYARLARRRASRMFTGEWRDRFETVRSILTWVDRRLQVEPATSDWSTETYLGFLWLHVGQLYLCFTQAGADMAALRQVFREAPSPLDKNLFGQGASGMYDISHPTKITYGVALLGALAYSLPDTPAVSWDVLKARAQDLFFADSDHTWPSGATIFDYSQAEDRLGSFYRPSPTAPPLSLLLDAEAENLSADRKLNLVNEALEQIRDGNLILWGLVYSVFHDLPHPAPLGDTLAATLANSDFQHLAHSRERAAALWAASSRVPHLDDEALRAHLESEIISLAETLADQQGSQASESSEQEHYMEELDPSDLMLEAVYQVTRSAPEGHAMRMATLLERLLEANPHFEPNLRIMLRNVEFALPADEAVHFARLNQRLRAM